MTRQQQQQRLRQQQMQDEQLHFQEQQRQLRLREEQDRFKKQQQGELNKQEWPPKRDIDALAEAQRRQAILRAQQLVQPPPQQPQRTQRQPQKHQQQSQQQQQQAQCCSGQQHHESARHGRRHRKSHPHHLEPHGTEAMSAGKDDDEATQPIQARSMSPKTAQKARMSKPAFTAPQQPPVVNEPEALKSSDNSKAADEQEELAQDAIKSSDEGSFPLDEEVQERSWKELQEIEENLDTLAEELEQILAGNIKDKKKILWTEENLTKAMLRIDAVDSGGDWDIRKKRKALIGHAEKLLLKVDKFKKCSNTNANAPSK
ncbi:hypothetical protein BGZ99_004150 [Dissophora globulifera]|uniref:BAG domain-containing protein n=1 Tax=Dissophora globulifera TaxID=979702 RepID=A0A9P6RIE4_9FUNG|nr:hypothetical protein BGZ99_004150 [Dissophora globulifera]